MRIIPAGSCQEQSLFNTSCRSSLRSRGMVGLQVVYVSGMYGMGDCRIAWEIHSIQLGWCLLRKYALSALGLGVHLVL